MQLGFFTMPIHPLDKDWQLSLAEDREAFILADELGFAEAYCGEHVTDVAENITSCAMFLATLIDATKTMKLGTGTINMANSHPVTVAAQIAMLDHLLDGRFIFGISPGGQQSDAEVYENLHAERGEMFLEAINQVLAIWSSEAPYDIKGKYWNITTRETLFAEVGQGTILKPLQRPHPPIVVTAVAPHSNGVREAAARGWDMISAGFLLPMWVKTHWPKYAEGCQRVGRAALPENWRVAKSVFVAKDDKTARDYVLGANSPYRHYYQQFAAKLFRAGRGNLLKKDPSIADEAVDVEQVFQELVIHGSPEKVTDEILTFREEIGDFGVLVYAGHDWLDRELARRSMILAAERVLPAVNAAIGARKEEAAE